jgi:hypothetical protein
MDATLHGVICELESQHFTKNAAWRVYDETNWLKADICWVGDWVVEDNRAGEFATRMRSAINACYGAASGEVAVDGKRVSLRLGKDDRPKTGPSVHLLDAKGFEISSAIALCAVGLSRRDPTTAWDCGPPGFPLDSPDGSVLWDPTLTAKQNIATVRQSCPAAQGYDPMGISANKLIEEFGGYCGGHCGMKYAIHISERLKSLKVTANNDCVLVNLCEKQTQFLRDVCHARLPFNVRTCALDTVAVEVVLHD